MKKQKTKRDFHWRTFDIPIFGGSVNVLFDNDWRTAAKLYGEYDDLSSSNALFDYHIIDGKFSCRIYFERNLNLGSISHECMHLLTHLAAHIAMPIRVECDEFSAYILAFFVRQCVDIHRKVTKKITKKPTKNRK
jgi:hypothetical protein